MIKRLYITILLIVVSITTHIAFAGSKPIYIDYYGDTLTIPATPATMVVYKVKPDVATVKQFYDIISTLNYQPIINTLLAYKDKHHLNDWLYYQLIRKTAQAIAPKAENYPRYTLYKWFLLSKSGYDATIAVSEDNQLFFYVHCDENIYDVPYYMSNGKQYVCLNRHDYAATYNLQQKGLFATDIVVPEAKKAFSYKVTQLPDFTPSHYTEKEIQFNYNNKLYHFKVKLSNDVQTAFTNYPVTDYASYFNIPLSHTTYSSLIPVLKQAVDGMKQKNGVDYLMQFTRNAFLYEDDKQSYGKENRMSPEQTLLNKYSDCDDRAALFFYLVKEVYNLPMIAILYPTHITVAVKFDKPIGQTIAYKGQLYTLCEPTPQLQDLRVGQVAPEFKNASYQIAFEYTPK
ncbi:hypothetical protein CAP35_09145 [Chitinophagaceae bacterium IBVUCB1]|nr:hypothetical protein CAP35_09145 [Chitinophagaceae bacterium IBVUCB1]